MPEGYVDRAKQRVGEEGEEDSEKVQRVKALEEMMKLQQIDEATFEKLREEILGDEAGVERAGLVKGLDRSMLERVKRGELTTEDVLEGRTGKREEGQVDTREEDVDDEFERLEEREVEAIHKDKEKKKGEMAPPALTGKKRNRDQILAELKAARLAAKEAAQPSLGSRFKKVGDRRGESRIERVDGLVGRTTLSLTRAALMLFVLQLALNFFWSILFFAWRRPDAAFVIFLLMWFAIAATIVAFAAIRPLAAILLVPRIWRGSVSLAI